tara:strand:- start:45 stop:242 length:198 start_codon:yes stop_codon:yes gene_type:complete
MLVNLSKEEMSTILYIMEGYIQGNDDYDEESAFYQDVNSIFSKIEGVIDACECQAQKDTYNELNP